MPEGFVEREAKIVNIAMGKVADMPDAARATMAQRIWSRLISPKLDKSLSREDRIHSMNQFISAQLGRQKPLPSEFGVKKKKPSGLKEVAAMLAAAGQGVGAAGVGMQHLVADITGVPKAVKETPREISGREKVQEVLGEGLAYDIPHTAGQIIPGIIAAGGAGAVAGTVPKLAQATGLLRAGKLGTEAAIATTPFHGEESFTGLPIEAEGAVLVAGFGPAVRGVGRLIRGGAKRIPTKTPKAAGPTEAAAENPFVKKAREKFGKTLNELSEGERIKLLDESMAEQKAVVEVERAAKKATKEAEKAAKVATAGKPIKVSEAKKASTASTKEAAKAIQTRVIEYRKLMAGNPTPEHLTRLHAGETVHDIIGSAPEKVAKANKIKVAAAKVENPQAKAAVESVAKVADEVTPKVLPDAVAPVATSIDDLGIRLSERELTTLSRTDMQRLAKVRLREDVTSITGRRMDAKKLDEVGKSAKKIIDKIDAADFSKIKKPTTIVKPGKASQASTEAERQAKSRMKTKRTISKEAQEGFSATGHPKEISDKMRLFQELTETSADDVVVEKLYTGTDVDSLALDYLSEVLGTVSKAGDVSEIARITNLMRKIYGG